MSRWIEGTFGCYAFEDDCKRCELFEKEDGVIE